MISVSIVGGLLARIISARTANDRTKIIANDRHPYNISLGDVQINLLEHNIFLFHVFVLRPQNIIFDLIFFQV